MARCTRAVFACALLWLGGCGTTTPYWARGDEHIHPRISPDRFHTVAVIAGDDNQAALQMTAVVRTLLADSGITALRAPGRWESQREAVEDLCMRGPFHGVVLVMVDRLSLRACPDREVAYEIRGLEMGVQNMANRLVAWLKSEE